MMTFLNDRLAIDRLKEEYLKHKNLVIGLDFDNTIYDYHKNGLDVSDLTKLMRQCSNIGLTICLYTIVTSNVDDMSVMDKLTYCDEHDIKISHFNTSPINLGVGKPFFNILLDDRAGLASSYNILKTALTELGLIL